MLGCAYLADFACCTCLPYLLSLLRLPCLLSRIRLLCLLYSLSLLCPLRLLSLLGLISLLCLFSLPSCFACYAYQKWSRGHKALGQGQGHKKSPRPRPRTAFPKTEPLKAKDRNARGQGQGHRLKRSPKKKVFKIFFQAISNLLAYPELLIGGGLKHKSHEMTSSKFFQRGSFCGTKIS